MTCTDNYTLHVYLSLGNNWLHASRKNAFWEKLNVCTIN